MRASERCSRSFVEVVRDHFRQVLSTCFAQHVAVSQATMRKRPTLRLRVDVDRSWSRRRGHRCICAVRFVDADAIRAGWNVRDLCVPSVAETEPEERSRIEGLRQRPAALQVAAALPAGTGRGG